MKILFATSECVPLYKRGGLGDVSHDLPLALRSQGIDVSVVMPFYAAVNIKNVECVGQISVDWAGKRELVFVFKTYLTDTSGQTDKNSKSSASHAIKVPVYLLRHPMLDDYVGKNITETFAFFSLSVTRIYLYLPHLIGGMFDIIHCHDWHTALIPMLLGESRKTRKSTSLAKRSIMKFDTIESESTKTVLTIHNLMYQGEASSAIIGKLGMPISLFHLINSEAGQYIKILREGLEYADVISTVSPTYATEILSKEYGEHVNDVLIRRRDRVIGILNGIDQALWNPTTDKAIQHNYTVETVLSIKPKLKHSLQKEMGLPNDDVPMLGFVGRIEPRQKGMDLIMEAVTKILEKPSTQKELGILFQLVILGTGEEKTVKELIELTKTFPNVKFVDEFDDKLARQIYAASDFMLVPSRFEPCGLTQLIAMRYGTVPIVRKTGGLADSVIDAKTGFVFEEYDSGALAEKITEAITLYMRLFHDEAKKDSKVSEKMATMIQNVMWEDFGWGISGKKYVKIYQELLRHKQIKSVS